MGAEYPERGSAGAQGPDAGRTRGGNRRAGRRQARSRLSGNGRGFCAGDPGRDDWRLHECFAEPTWAVVGRRPIRPEAYVLDLVAMGACDRHLFAIRAYLGEFAEPWVGDPRVWRAHAEQWKADLGPDVRLMGLAKAN